MCVAKHQNDGYADRDASAVQRHQLCCQSGQSGVHRHGVERCELVLHTQRHSIEVVDDIHQPLLRKRRRHLRAGSTTVCVASTQRVDAGVPPAADQSAVQLGQPLRAEFHERLMHLGLARGHERARREGDADEALRFLRNARPLSVPELHLHDARLDDPADLAGGVLAPPLGMAERELRLEVLLILFLVESCLAPCMLFRLVDHLLQFGYLPLLLVRQCL
mmetsp:Transcript_43468/g.120282  ORF Transcript_43468/g.120282 Transcript_43468/m.120282 type:complete len:220 (-) Transcript_43468:908-1567(-)